MATLSAPPSRVKPNRAPRRSQYTPPTQRDRKLVLAAWHAVLQAGALRIVAEGNADVYFLQRNVCDFGTPFRVEKWRPAKLDDPAGCEDPYDVCVAGEDSTCECKGFLRHGHCRHVEALTALIRA